MGKNEVEDAVLRLDMLTKEESLMVLVRNLEIAHRVDGVAHELKRLSLLATIIVAPQG